MSAPFDLDQPCGRHFTFRDLIECGDTWRRLAAAARDDPQVSLPDNVPREAGTWQAISDLCSGLLDPLVEAFGDVQLTYGFAGRTLTRRIPRRIEPRLDQHAGHELNRRGKPICPRLGMAVDLRVPGRGAHEIGRWLVSNIAFDRICYYGPELPLHVSMGPEHTRMVVFMRTRSDGGLYPGRRATGRWPE